jgi:hypothetical protein
MPRIRLVDEDHVRADGGYIVLHVRADVAVDVAGDGDT